MISLYVIIFKRSGILLDKKYRQFQTPPLLLTVLTLRKVFKILHQVTNSFTQGHHPIYTDSQASRLDRRSSGVTSDKRITRERPSETVAFQQNYDSPLIRMSKIIGVFLEDRQRNTFFLGIKVMSASVRKLYHRLRVVGYTSFGKPINYRVRVFNGRF